MVILCFLNFHLKLSSGIQLGHLPLEESLWICKHVMEVVDFNVLTDSLFDIMCFIRKTMKHKLSTFLISFVAEQFLTNINNSSVNPMENPYAVSVTGWYHTR
jgi:hypothetical protein